MTEKENPILKFLPGYKIVPYCKKGNVRQASNEDWPDYIDDSENRTLCQDYCDICYYSKEIHIPFCYGRFDPDNAECTVGCGYPECAENTKGLGIEEDNYGNRYYSIHD